MGSWARTWSWGRAGFGGLGLEDRSRESGGWCRGSGVGSQRTGAGGTGVGSQGTGVGSTGVGSRGWCRGDRGGESETGVGGTGVGSQGSGVRGAGGQGTGPECVGAAV